MKKYFATVLCMGILAASAFVASACGPVESGNTALSGWTDTAVTAEAGDTFSVTEEMRSASDSEGNVYRAEYSVETEDGERVTPIFDEFTVEYGKVYIITFTVSVGENVYTRRITVTAEDTRAPVISFTRAEKTGITGREYTFPHATVSDNSGNIASRTAEVYYLNGEDRGKVETGNAASFVPQEDGEYIYRLEATDAEGNSAAEEYTFYIRDLEMRGEIESFNHATSVESVTGGAYDKLEWLESYEGAEGVIKFTYGSQEWPYLTVTPRQSRDYYESAKYVVYRMRFEGGNNPVLINCYGDALSDAEGWKINIDPVEGEWTEYFFDARVLLEFFDNYSENRLVWYATQGTPGAVYIDDVYCVWEAADIEISTQNCKLADVPEEGILLEASSEAYTGEYEYIVKELDAFGNETGDNLASGNRFMPEKTANYLIIARPSDPSYTGEARKTIVVNADKFISLSGDILPVDPIAGDEISIPTGQVSDGIEILPQQVSLSALYNGVPMEIKNGAFTPSVSGTLSLTYSSEGCVPVIREAEVRRNPELKAGEVESFDDPAALEESIATNGGAEWLEEYEGEKGVLKLTFKDSGSADTNWFNLQLLPRSDDASFYVGDELVIRMYFAVDNEFNDGINTYGDAGAQAAGIKVNNPIVRGVWRNYVFNADVLREYFGNTAENRMVWWSDHVMTADAVVYVADIFVRQAPARAENVVEDYADAGSVDRSYTSAFEKTEWLDEFQGKQGVLKITYKENDWPYLFVMARHAATNYAKYGDIVYRMWIEDGNNPLQVNKYGNDDNSVGQDYTPVSRGQWAEYTYNADIFLTAPDNPSFNRMVWYGSNTVNEGYIYIDEIYMARSRAEAGEVENFGESESLNRVFTDAQKEWLESYQGENGVLKLTFSADNAEIWPYLSVLYRHSASHYQNMTKIVYRMWIEDPFWLVDVNQYGNGSTGDLHIDPVRGAWHDYEFSSAPLLEHRTYWTVNRLFWRRKAVSQPTASVCIYITAITAK